MKSKILIQVLIALLVLFSTTAGIGPAAAQADGSVTVVVRELSYWDATYTGFVDSLHYDKWPFAFDVAESFSVTVTPATEGLSPLILLLDANGNEINRANGALTSSQPAGSYALLIQPDSGSGNYSLIIRRTVDQAQPSVSAVVSPASINVGDSSTATVSLGDVPAEGYTSVEFTCTYDAALAEGGNIAVSDLFGSDPAVAINGPQNGSFIVAIAGSDGNKATTGGAALTFSLQGLQAGQTAVECKARTSKGDNVLTDVPSSTPASLTINDVPVNGTLTGQVLAGKPVTVNLFDVNNLLVDSMPVNADGTFSLSAPAATYTAVATASGFLNAQGSVTLTAGATSTLSTVSLPAGDIDGNGVIDQFDAMTIGMSYNTADPTAADLNNDGIINVLDLELLAANYRKSGALAWQ